MGWLFLGCLVVLAGFLVGMYYLAGHLFTRWYTKPQEDAAEVMDTGEIPAEWTFFYMRRACKLGRFGKVYLRYARWRVMRRLRAIIRDINNTSAINDEYERKRQVSELKRALNEWRQRDEFFEA